MARPTKAQPKSRQANKSKDQDPRDKQQQTSSPPIIPGSLPPTTDEELKQAIRSLESSTAAIDKQIALLKSQQASLQALSRENAARTKDFETASHALERSWMHESQRLAVVAEELSSETSGTLRTLHEHVGTAVRAVQPAVTAQLKSHDRILEQLNTSVGNALDAATGEKRSQRERSEKLATVLAGLTMEEIRCRLDRIYMESVSEEHHYEETDEDQGDGAGELDDAIASIEASISPLQAEITSVAEMVVNHAYRDPLLLALHQANDIATSRSTSKQNDILSTLTQLTDSTHQTADRLLEFQSFRAALVEMQALTSDIIAASSKATPSPPSKQTLKPTGNKTASSSSSSSAPVLENRPALLALLQNLGVPINPTADLPTIHSTLRSYTQRLRTSTHQSHAQMTVALQSHLTSNRQALDRVNNVVARDDLTTNADLMDRVDELGGRVGQVGRQIESVGAKVEDLSTKPDRTRDEFVRRWDGSGGQS